VTIEIKITAFEDNIKCEEKYNSLSDCIVDFANQIKKSCIR
jgi:hypothetical protein